MNTKPQTMATLRPSSLKARQKKLAASGPRHATRKEMRAIARHNMEMEGVTRMNRKRGEKKESFFSINWRKYVGMKPRVRTARQKG